jgi:hypothetical protein
MEIKNRCIGRVLGYLAFASVFIPGWLLMDCVLKIETRSWIMIYGFLVIGTANILREAIEDYWKN